MNKTAAAQLRYQRKKIRANLEACSVIYENNFWCCTRLTIHTMCVNRATGYNMLANKTHKVRTENGTFLNWQMQKKIREQVKHKYSKSRGDSVTKNAPAWASAMNALTLGRWSVKLERVGELSALVPRIHAPVRWVVRHHNVHAVRVSELQADIEVFLLVQVIGKVEIRWAAGCILRCAQQQELLMIHLLLQVIRKYAPVCLVCK